MGSLDGAGGRHWTLGFCTGHDLRVLGLSPVLGSALSMESS